MQLPFVKMQGAGNQIMVVDQRHADVDPPSPARIRRLGDVDNGPGFDQLMWVGPASDSSLTASYRVFNADGSEVEQCGNGVRCIASWLAREIGATEFTFESPAGPIEAQVLEDGSVSVNMGPPEFEPDSVPFIADARADRYDIDVEGVSLNVAVLSMGNPHCVLDVDDVATADVDRLGPLLERHPVFPARANIGFMHVRDRHQIDLRVFERGAGETPACGTGACAAVVTGIREDRLEDEVAVRLPGGQLVVSWRGGSEPVWLTGNAELISEGTIDL